MASDIDSYPEARFVDVAGTRTRYYDIGEGRPILLIHGGTYRSYATADDWSRNIASLAGSNRVVALDKLGQGHTDNPTDPGDYTLTATSRHIREFVRLVDLRQLTVVGHSRGALPAAVLALDEPERVVGLVVIDSNTLAPEHPDTPTEFYARIDKARPSVADEAFVRREPEANSFLKHHVSGEFVSRRLMVALLSKVREATRMIEENLESVFRPDHERLREETLRRVSSGELRAATSIIWGYNDPSAPLVLGRLLYDIFAAADPAAELHILNHSGHYPYREHAATCNDLIAGFARRTAGRREG